MQRRTVIKQLAFASGALLLIPACMQDSSKTSISLKKIKIDAGQEKLLAALTETIIPGTDESPGAKAVLAHLFVLMMVDDCYDPAGQQKFITGLKDFETATKKQYSRSFVNCTPAEKELLLTELETKKSGDEDLGYFYKTVKKLTIQAFTTSQYFLTEVKEYKLIPGHFSGCVPVKDVS
jgi:Gluconate 2-dehydrogenase subunit 3